MSDLSIVRKRVKFFIIQQEYLKDKNHAVLISLCFLYLDTETSSTSLLTHHSTSFQKRNNVTLVTPDTT